jgi:translation elongation factor P/translation initiation factor 5A
MANWGQWLTYTEGGMFVVIDAGDFDHLYVSAEAIG